MQKQGIFYTIVVAVILLSISYGISYHHMKKVDTTDESKTPINGDFASPIPPLGDFRRYPCLRKDSNLPSDENSRGCVRTVSIPASEKPSSNTTCVILEQANTDICTYDPSKDLISRHLHKSGKWEPHLVNALIETLKANPGYVFLDIGCNIGVYSITAAATKTTTICVDANPENLDLVAKSLSRGRLENNVTIVWNALSDHRRVVNFQVIKGNSGASRIGDISKYKMTKKKDISVNAIMLNDLEWLVRGKSLFMKMDAEAHELYVLNGAYTFFKNVDVRIIQMELLEKETFSAVVDLLATWGYSMFRDPLGSKVLERSDFGTNRWPGDMYFIKS